MVLLRPYVHCPQWSDIKFSDGSGYVRSSNPHKCADRYEGTLLIVFFCKIALLVENWNNRRFFEMVYCEYISSFATLITSSILLFTIANLFISLYYPFILQYKNSFQFILISLSFSLIGSNEHMYFLFFLCFCYFVLFLWLNIWIHKSDYFTISRYIKLDNWYTYD